MIVRHRPMLLFMWKTRQTTYIMQAGSIAMVIIIIIVRFLAHPNGIQFFMFIRGKKKPTAILHDNDFINRYRQFRLSPHRRIFGVYP